MVIVRGHMVVMRGDMMMRSKNFTWSKIVGVMSPIVDHVTRWNGWGRMRLMNMRRIMQ